MSENSHDRSELFNQEHIDVQADAERQTALDAMVSFAKDNGDKMQTTVKISDVAKDLLYSDWTGPWKVIYHPEKQELEMILYEIKPGDLWVVKDIILYTLSN